VDVRLERSPSRAAAAKLMGIDGDRLGNGGTGSFEVSRGRCAVSPSEGAAAPTELGRAAFLGAAALAIKQSLGGGWCPPTAAATRYGVEATERCFDDRARGEVTRAHLRCNLSASVKQIR